MNEREFELNLQSPAFKQFNNDLNGAILTCLHEIYDGNFAGGDINAKISLDLESAVEVYQVGTDESGKAQHKGYNYKKPSIDYRVTLTLKKRDEAKGTFNPPQTELKRDNERFIVCEVKTAQLTLSDAGGS